MGGNRKMRICLVILLTVLLLGAGTALAIGAPDIYAERLDLGRYNGDSENVSVRDNGETLNVNVNLLPIDEIGNIVWPPVDGAAWYKVSVRDVDSDCVVFNEDRQDPSRYWFNPGSLNVGTNYKLAVGAYASEEDYAWGNYFYFRMIESSYEEPTWEDEYAYAEEPTWEDEYAYAEEPTWEDEYTYVEEPTWEDEYTYAEEPTWEDEYTYVEPDEGNEYQVEVVTQLQGYLELDSFEMEVGSLWLLPGQVGSTGSPLNRVTYQIDGWAGDDENNRYCSQEVGGAYVVNLGELNELLLDGTRAPLNVPGTYTLRLVASCEDGSWNQLDEMTIVVTGGEPAHSPEDNPMPEELVENETQIQGYLELDSFEMEVGSLWLLPGQVGSTGSPLNRVTYQIDGWAGDDENNRYCSQEVGGAYVVNLGELNELLLDGTRAPLNVPGTYTLRLVASCEDGSWNQLDEMTIVVTGGEPAHSPEDNPMPEELVENETQIQGYLELDSFEMEVGSLWLLPGQAGSIGSPLNRVTYQIDGWAGDDENNRYCSQEVGGAYVVNLGEMNELLLDGTRAPLNVPGTYTLRLVASCEDGSWNQLDEMTIVVTGGEPAVPDDIQLTYPAKENNHNCYLSTGDIFAIQGTVAGNVRYVRAQLEVNGGPQVVPICVEGEEAQNSILFQAGEDGTFAASFTAAEDLNPSGNYAIAVYGYGDDVGSTLLDSDWCGLKIVRPKADYGFEPEDSEATRLLKVAVSQIGYSDADYTYSEFTGTSGQNWCASFVSWCANEAGIKAISHTASNAHPGAQCPDGKIICFYTENNWEYEKHLSCCFKNCVMMKRGEYIPDPGDLIFFRWDGKEASFSHVGIVMSASNGYVHYIDGNSNSGGGKVAEHDMLLTDSQIVAFGKPKYSDAIWTTTETGASGSNVSAQMTSAPQSNESLEFTETVSNEYESFVQKGNALDYLSQLNTLKNKSAYKVTSDDVLDDFSDGGFDVWVKEAYKGLTSGGAVKEIAEISKDQELALMIDIVKEMVNANVIHEDSMSAEVLNTTFDIVANVSANTTVLSEPVAQCLLKLGYDPVVAAQKSAEWVGADGQKFWSIDATYGGNFNVSHLTYGLTAVSTILDCCDIYSVSMDQKEALINSVMEYDANMQALDRIINASTGTLRAAAKQVQKELEDAYIGQFDSIKQDAVTGLLTSGGNTIVNVLDLTAPIRAIYRLTTNQTGKKVDAEFAFIEYSFVLTEIQDTCLDAIIAEDQATYDLLQLYCIGLQKGFDNVYEYYESYGKTWLGKINTAFGNYDSDEILSIITEQKGRIDQLQQAMTDEIK